MIRTIYIIAVIVFLLLGPFSLGILISATQIEQERHKLLKMYKICRNISIFALVLVLLILARYDYLGPNN